MKKTLILAALALAVSAASADVTGFATYDYGRASGSPYLAQHEAQVGLKLGTSLGTFDVAAVGKEGVTRVRSDSYGVEAGYSLAARTQSGIALTGRVGLGQVEQAKYYSLGAEVSAPVLANANLFAGFRHRNGFTADTASAVNRVTVGADVSLTKSVSARIGYERVTAGGRDSNGVTTAVAYSF